VLFSILSAVCEYVVPDIAVVGVALLIPRRIIRLISIPAILLPKLLVHNRGLLLWVKTPPRWASRTILIDIVAKGVIGLGNDGTTHKAWQESGVCNLPGMGKFVDQQLAFCRISLGMAAKRIGIGAAKITIDLPIDTRCRKPTSTQTAKVGQDDLVVGDGIPKDFAGQIDLGLGKRMRVIEGITHRPGCYSCNNSENEHNTYSCAQGCCNHKHSHAAEHPNGAARTQVGMNPADSLLCYGDDGTHSRADDSPRGAQRVKLKQMSMQKAAVDPA
jgi:hypothetical protein